MDWNTSQQNLQNRADKSAIQLNNLIPTLKKIALQDGAFSPTANPDENRSELMSNVLNYLKNFWNQAGVSFRDYFCKLLRELKKGKTDYENLLLMTICK